MNELLGCFVFVVGFYLCFRAIKSAIKEWDSFYFINMLVSGLFGIISGLMLLLGFYQLI